MSQEMSEQMKKAVSEATEGWKIAMEQTNKRMEEALAEVKAARAAADIAQQRLWKYLDKELERGSYVVVPQDS